MLGIAVLLLALDHVHLVPPTPIAAPSPTTRPAFHFALDDIDLGPRVRLTRFIPDFDIYPRSAIEGPDGKLYVAYYPNRPPYYWNTEGGEASRLGILDKGRITPIVLSKEETSGEPLNPGRIDIVGLQQGQPVVSIIEPGPRERYVEITTHGIQTLQRIAPTLEDQPWPPCIPFDGGKICDDHSTNRYRVKIDLPNHSPILVSAAGNVWLAGGGRHRFLLVEYDGGSAECLEGYAP
jgi:hypothetical protein